MDGHTDGLVLTEEVIEKYLTALQQKGRSEGTLQAYRLKIDQLYEGLPEDKTVYPGTLADQRETMRQQGIPAGTINLLTAAANGLFDFCGRRDLQLGDSIRPEESEAPELSRTEYLRLLTTAKLLEKEKAYLFIKVLANTGIYIRELPLVTAEAVRIGKINTDSRGTVPISCCLRAELEDFCSRNGILSGPIFITAGGKPVKRAHINSAMGRIGVDAKVDREKCNPMALRRLYLTTQKQIQEQLENIAWQNYEKMIETEQLLVGWNE